MTGVINKLIKFTCPCCGYITLEESGEYEICPLCRWEDDLSQSLYPYMNGGANKPSLVEAQHNFKNYGISNPNLNECSGNINEFTKDIYWRPIEEINRKI